MKDEFKLDSCGLPSGVEGEETLKLYDFNLNLLGFTRVLITKDIKKDKNGDIWLNYYIVDERFKKEPLNCLDYQTDIKQIKNKKGYYLSEEYAEILAIQKYLWFKYSKEEPISFSIERSE